MESIRFTLALTQGLNPKEMATSAIHLHAVLARLPQLKGLTPGAGWQTLSALALLLRGSAPSAQEQEDEVLWVKVRVPGVKPLVRVRFWVEAQ